MEGVPHLDHLLAVAALGGLAHLLDEKVQPAEVGGGEEVAGGHQRVALDEPPGGVGVADLLGRRLGEEAAHLRPVDDDAAGGEFLQCLAHRGPADAQLGGDQPFLELLAGLAAPVEERLVDMLDDMVLIGGLLDGRHSRCLCSWLLSIVDNRQ